MVLSSIKSVGSVADMVLASIESGGSVADMILCKIFVSSPFSAILAEQIGTADSGRLKVWGRYCISVT